MKFEVGHWYNLDAKRADEFAESCEDNAAVLQTVIQPFYVLEVNPATGGVVQFENAYHIKSEIGDLDIISGIDAYMFVDSHPIHPWLMHHGNATEMTYIPEPFRTWDPKTPVHTTTVEHEVVDVSQMCQLIGINNDPINASAICYQMDYGYRYGWKNWSAE
ncbi:hypothetical protein AHP1_1961 [Aeromonas phage Ahp1_CNU-2021]|nr:hypothetical protein AHP1_1961 [Aeromonas phage Ahp1_CNU-2021]